MTLEDVENLERARVAAMISGDVAAFERLLSEDMRWSHASGKVDSKASMIAQYAEGSMRCFAIERSDTAARIFGGAAVVTGVVAMDAMAGGVRKQVRSRYAGIWSDHAGAPQLVNWMSARDE